MASLAIPLPVEQQSEPLRAEQQSEPLRVEQSAAPPLEPPAALPSLPPLLGTYVRAPMELVSGEGVELVDADGRRYLDFTSGIGVSALGYGDRGFQDVVSTALASGLVHVSNLFRTRPGEELAELLVARSFASSVFFCNSGAEANEGAFKFARRWGRTVHGPAKAEIVALRGSFHGRLFATLAATDRPQYRTAFKPVAPGVSIAERDLESLAQALSSDTTAAVVLEPVQGEGGVRVLDPGFLRELRALTTERGIALILDEVQCGLGRTGRLFAYEHSGITPDMVTLAKPLAGGLPMGAILVAGHVARTISPGDHATTFGGGPLVAAAARYVFGRVSDPVLLESVRGNGEWLGCRLREIARASGRARGVRGQGYMWGVDVREPATAVVRRGWDAGILMLTAGEHTLRLLPPLVTTRQQLRSGLQLIEEVL
ncbi:MAG TPA: acetylornithine transaminase [Gemmatimonadaceae bacterium]|nr:acetylornithine transaminase [Gemmatimonadaceae bacterium]